MISIFICIMFCHVSFWPYSYYLFHIKIISNHLNCSLIFFIHLFVRVMSFKKRQFRSYSYQVIVNLVYFMVVLVDMFLVFISTKKSFEIMY